jgi:hypothetical protein
MQIIYDLFSVEAIVMRILRLRQASLYQFFLCFLFPAKRRPRIKAKKPIPLLKRLLKHRHQLKVQGNNLLKRLG